MKSSQLLLMMDGAELCFPQLNSSCRKTIHPPSLSILIYFGLSSISLLTMTLNLLVIISISHFRQLHTPTNLLLLSLAVSDFLCGICMFCQMMVIDDCWYQGDIMCVFHPFFNIIIFDVSIENIVLISVDRYVAICYPLHYSTKVTTKRVQICVSLCWIFTVFYVILQLRGNLKQPGRLNSCFGECVIEFGFIENVVDLILTIIIPITIIVLLYLRIFVVAVSQVQAMRSHAAVTLQRSGKTFVKKSELKAAGTLGIVVVVFLICLLPFYCEELMRNNTDHRVSTLSFVKCLLLFNSCLNPLIYALFYPWFRKCLKLIFTFQVLKSGSRNANILLQN